MKLPLIAVALLVMLSFSANALTITIQNPTFDSNYTLGESIPIHLTTDVPAVCKYGFPNNNTGQNITSGITIVAYHCPQNIIDKYNSTGIIPLNVEQSECTPLNVPSWFTFNPTFSELTSSLTTNNDTSFNGSISGLELGTYNQFFAMCQQIGNSSNENWRWLTLFNVVEPLNITVNSPIENGNYTNPITTNVTTNIPAKCKYQMSYTLYPNSSSGNGGIGVGITPTFFSAYFSLGDSFETSHISNITVPKPYDHVAFSCIDEDNINVGSGWIPINATTILHNYENVTNETTTTNSTQDNNQQSTSQDTNTATTSDSSSSSHSSGSSYHYISGDAVVSDVATTQQAVNHNDISLSGSQESSGINPLFFILPALAAVAAVTVIVVVKRR